MPRNQSAGRDSVWGIPQRVYVRELKQGGADQWLHHRFLALKKQFLDEGVSAFHAWYDAAALIPPPDFSEERCLTLLRAHDKQNNTQRAQAWALEVRLNPPPEDASIRGSHLWLLQQRDINPVGKTYVPQPVAGKKKGAHKIIQVDSAMKKLLAAGMDKKANEREEVRWAMEWLLFEWHEIDERSVPSKGAVTMLFYAKSDTQAFMRDMVRNLLPSRTEIDSEAKRKDLGRTLFDEEEDLLLTMARSAEKEASQ
jgi:hypothetical protein